MSENIQTRPKLLIVSDTAVYKDESGRILAFEPVVREIEHFYPMFDSITWIAAEYPYHKEIRNIKEIKDVPLKYILYPAIGGSGLFQKFRIIIAYVSLTKVILSNIFKNDVIHSRGPSHAAIISGIFSLFIRSKIFWHKYAGNWSRKKDPLSYKIQKKILRIAVNSKVTINGHWPNQPSYILSFENPCLTKAELAEGNNVVKTKDFEGKLDFVFVGNMVDTKGVKRILEAFIKIKSESRIGMLHLVGDGPQKHEYMQFAITNNIEAIFHGFLSKLEVNRILATSHVLLLPSDSEGFPKVVAEAANFGCIPVVSDISCLSQYIRNNDNGFLLDSLNSENLASRITYILTLQTSELKQISKNSNSCSNIFGYEYYNQSIRTKILAK